MHEATEPLIPREKRPTICQERYCSYTLEPDLVLVHEGDEGITRFQIPQDRLADTSCDIWREEVVPWLERQHREAGA